MDSTYIKDGDIVVGVVPTIVSTTVEVGSLHRVIPSSAGAQFFAIEEIPDGQFFRDGSQRFRKATPEEALQYNLEQAKAKKAEADSLVAKLEEEVRHAEEAKVFVEGSIWRHSAGLKTLRILRKDYTGAWKLYGTDGIEKNSLGTNPSAARLTAQYTPVTDFEAALKELFANV